MWDSTRCRALPPQKKTGGRTRHAHAGTTLYRRRVKRIGTGLPGRFRTPTCRAHTEAAGPTNETGREVLIKSGAGDTAPAVKYSSPLTVLSIAIYRQARIGGLVMREDKLQALPGRDAMNCFVPKYKTLLNRLIVTIRISFCTFSVSTC